MANKVIIVVTNNEKLGDTGKKTGWYLPEVAHPYHVFKKAGFDITFVSPKGGHSPMDPGSGEQFKEDPVCKEFLAGPVKDLDNTKSPSQVKISDYKALIYAGGHGPMWDLPENKEVADLCSTLYKNGGVVAAVCHGTVGFVPVKLDSGEYLVKGKKVTSFTNAEEDAVALSSVMPFMLETRLKEIGADFVAGENWKENVVVDGRIVTGQNPASATGMAEAIVKLVKK